MILKIVFKNIFNKKLNAVLAVLLMALGIALVDFVTNIGKQLEQKFENNISGIDMVLGAKGSPLQLILSSIFQIDSPTGNIILDDVLALKSNPLIKQIIPLSMGDNYQSFRIVGTDSQYFQHFKARLQNGQLFNANLEVVLGANVAKNLNLKINDQFSSSHGLDAEGEKHQDQKYKVVGILMPNQSVIDNLILCNLESIWQIHQHKELVSKEITSALVTFRSPMGLMTIPRNINQNTKMQAALPSIEINRLLQLLGFGFEGLKYLAVIIIFISGLSVFVNLYNSLKDRKYEMALMLSMGANRLKLFTILVLEGLFIAFGGYVLGIIISKIAFYVMSKYNVINQLDLTLNFQKEEFYLLLASILVGIFAAIIPSLGIYRIDISKTLASE